MSAPSLTAPPSTLAPPSDKPPQASWLSRIYGLPRGIFAPVAGYLMARSNAAICRVVVDLLDVSPSDRILEIGFGPGVLIEMLAARVTAGKVAGVDPSEPMLQQAKQRNQKAIEAGRAQLFQSTSSELPFADETFTKACTVNTLRDWSSPLEDLRQVRRILVDGGLLLIALRMEHPRQNRFMAPGFTSNEIREVAEVLRRAGFNQIRAEVRRAGNREFTCLLANR
jgi:ubiquinone/menaquinone biosynthesis C-methylase UbiE